MTHNDQHPEHDRSRDVDELDLAGGGIWAVLSTSPTVYHLDLDRQMLCREPGLGSPTGKYDHQWIPLVQVHAYVPDGGGLLTLDRGRPDVIRVGCRRLYVMDPAPGTPLRWTSSAGQLPSWRRDRLPVRGCGERRCCWNVRHADADATRRDRHARVGLPAQRTPLHPQVRVAGDKPVDGCGRSRLRTGRPPGRQRRRPTRPVDEPGHARVVHSVWITTGM
jgi:hypothetical protein